MFDVSKERDKDFLRAAVQLLQEKVIRLEAEYTALKKEKVRDEEVCIKLSEELFLLKKSVYDSKADTRKRARERAQERREKGKGNNSIHNKPENEPPPPDPKSEEATIYLEQETEEHKLEDESKCPKCGEDKGFTPINSYQESGEIQVVERRYIFKNHRQQKYHCKCCSSIVTAPGGVKLTPGGEFSIQLATQVAADKYEDHIPLNRQKNQMAREGLEVGTKTLFRITEHLYRLIQVLLELIRQDVLGGNWIHIDESPMPFFNPGKSRGYVWSMSNNRGAYYQFEPNRKGEVAKEMMKGYHNGVVVTDGFTGYGFLDKMDGIKHAFCWAHVLRKFVDSLNFDEDARPVVDWIDSLYDIEKRAGSFEELALLRRRESAPIVKKIDDWVASMEGHYLESTVKGKAINYYKERFDGLHYFLYDANVPIDNNMAERRQRCPVMGRKNFLHFKSINGADVGVFFYTVIESCKTNNIPARAYINEMAHRVAKKEKLESPYQYAARLRREAMQKIDSGLAEIPETQDLPQ